MNIDITQKAMLIKLSIGIPGNSRKDTATTEAVKTEHSLGKDAGRWNKQLYPSSALKAIQSLAGNARQYVYSRTNSYPDEGWYVLPAKLHPDLTKYLATQKMEFENLASEFESKFQEYVEWAKIEHNGTFDSSLYDLQKTMAKFYFSVEFRPVPQSTQYEQTIQSILGVDAQSIDNAVNEAIETGQQNLWKRVINTLKEISGLSGRERKVKEPFIKDLFSRLADMKNLIPALNLADDTDLNQLADEISSQFGQHDAMTVRNDDSMRESVAKQADAVIKKLKASDDIIKKLAGYSF